MSDAAAQNTPNSSRRSNTPEETTTEVRKRRRIALSCYDCRRRKLRCDREYPACGRCRKGGHADTCSYDSRAEPPAGARNGHQPVAESDDDRAAILSPTSSNTVPRAPVVPDAARHGSRDSADLLSVQRKKIAELETRLAQLEGKTKDPFSNGQAIQHAGDELLWPNPTSSNRRGAEEEESETMLLRGKAFKTAYFGRSNITSVVITHFPGLRSFMQATFKQYPALMQGRPEIKAIRERWKKHKLLSTPTVDLEALLPPKDNVDHLVRHYFDTLETTHRILHVPNFWDEYAHFWTEPSRRRPEFTATVLAVISTVITATFDPPTTYRADRPIQVETAMEWIESIERWLSMQSRKHADLSHFQIRCLLMQTKCVNSIKWKEIWGHSRDLITFGLSTGLHRDPSWLVKETTIFDQEMRRRLWWTMLEMELQCSIYRGMPSSSHGLFTDTSPPLNVNDEDIDNTARKAPPTPWPVQEFTATSYLYVSAKSMPLRVEINSALNNAAAPLTYDETMAYAEKVVAELEKIPAWSGRDDSKITRMLLDIQLRQFLVLLHEPFARKAGSDSRFQYSRTACFDSAASVIEQHYKIMSMGNKTVLLPLWNDTARAAISIIHNAFMSSLAQDYRFFQNHKAAIADLVEKSLILIEEKATRTGAGFGHMGHISAAYDLLIAKVLPEKKDEVLKHNVERVLRLHRTMMTSQERLPELPSETAQANNQPVVPIGYTTAPGMPNVQLPYGIQMAQPGSEQQPIISFPEIQGWGLDELWGFGPTDL
ncbi:Transcription factor lepE [Lasiodiplodia hormozganensis]|uniref:Transcription factor lepE n=1 Tax=Lasiodiplodia hormozganensis TaxID=869390 RepID=A0AA39YF73_9PEZI|nr:Transcription factor lepE [Lasiodiplodia hormozganensis]